MIRKKKIHKFQENQLHDNNSLLITEGHDHSDYKALADTDALVGFFAHLSQIQLSLGDTRANSPIRMDSQIATCQFWLVDSNQNEPMLIQGPVKPFNIFEQNHRIKDKEIHAFSWSLKKNLFHDKDKSTIDRGALLELLSDLVECRRPINRALGRLGNRSRSAHSLSSIPERHWRQFLGYPSGSKPDCPIEKTQQNFIVNQLKANGSAVDHGGADWVTASNSHYYGNSDPYLCGIWPWNENHGHGICLSGCDGCGDCGGCEDFGNLGDLGDCGGFD